MRSVLPAALVSLVASLSPMDVGAHEFWLSPVSYQVAPGAPVQVNLRVGENFKGAAYMYNEHRFERFDTVVGETVTSVEGMLGNVPALDQTAPTDDGLVIVVHETDDSRLTYREWAKFVKFVKHKDFRGVLEAHVDRGIRQEQFKESYRRLAKSLIAVGSGAGADRAVGLTLEIVALENPYTDDLSEGLALHVLRDGAPRGDAQLELFEKAPDGNVTVTLYRTDAEGNVTIPVQPGHEYLADAVMLDDTGNDDPEAGPVWHSLWASLTFAVPE